ncbi:uncharacterized protein F4812DRAFT_459688 [Daldinia caldariorum]|uniref:uncharacterized protein n=1 Tax=Daldinia caldariorum TaxID=326644 RepID=UPI002008B3CE|nr:uncharacterized protein F4812DRAFT_459688 [Daldinia caldariorum]KAI1467581.1 hypothetical protein F4812DRAFT_459688 [Daldinia caldariorum]
MASTEQNDQTKASKSFEMGAMSALPNVDLSSGIFEAPGAIEEANRGGDIDPKRRNPRDTAGAGAMIL